MAALISIRFDKHILPYITNYPVEAPLRRRTIRVIVIFFLAGGRGLDTKDIMRGRMEFSKSSGCMKGFKFCLSSTICSLSDCETTDSSLPFPASKINLAFFPFFWFISSQRSILLCGRVVFYCLRKMVFGLFFLLLLSSWGFFVLGDFSVFFFSPARSFLCCYIIN